MVAPLAALMAVVMLYHNPNPASLRSCVHLRAAGAMHIGLWYPASLSAIKRLDAYRAAIRMREIREDHARRDIA